jgi:hypothetical protein
LSPTERVSPGALSTVKLSHVLTKTGIGTPGLFCFVTQYSVYHHFGGTCLFGPHNARPGINTIASPPTDKATNGQTYITRNGFKHAVARFDYGFKPGGYQNTSILINAHYYSVQKP